MSSDDIVTCEDARTYWGLCCIESCSDTATLAVLDHIVWRQP